MAEASAAAGRRVIYSSYVVPQEVLVLEEGDATVGQLKKYVMESGCGRTFGGKGIVTDVAADQWGESWTSMQHAQQYWEQYSSFWEDSMEVWNNVGVTISGVTSLVADTDIASTVVKFLYIRNLGTNSNQRLKVSLDGSTNYVITIPANGSIALRGDGTNLQMEDVKVALVDQNTTIEFIIAK